MNDKLPRPPKGTAPRRVNPALLLLPLALLAVAVPAAVAMRDDDGGTSAAPTTTRLTITSTTVRATSTIGANASTSTTVAGGSTTTSVARSTTTAAPPVTEAPASTTTTGAPTRCGPDAFSVTTSTDKASYARGETVKITSTVTNKSSNPCTLPNYTYTFRVENEASATVGPEGAIRADSQPQPLQPNQRLTVEALYDALVCGSAGACTPAPAGGYTVIGTWNVSTPSPPESTARFRFEG